MRDKVKNKWYLLEGSVCEVEKIMEKTELKLEKYIELRAGIKDKYKECEKAQFSIVLDFLRGYNLTLEENLSTLTEDKRETPYVLKKAQKRILSQNTEIVKWLFYKQTLQKNKNKNKQTN